MQIGKIQNKKILIFGAHGMLGRECAQGFSNDFELVLLSHEQCDVGNSENVTQALAKHHPDIVVNCAGIIDLSVCEKNPDLAYRVNAEGPGNIARVLKNSFPHAIFLQFSTCYVFGNEKKEFDEFDIPDPLNVYGKSKLAGEQLIQEIFHETSVRFLIMRTSWIYSEFRETFVDFVVKSLRENKKIDVLSDQFNTVTWTKDLTAACISFIVQPDAYVSGFYHVVAQTDFPLSKFEIAYACADIMQLDAKLLIPANSDAIHIQNRPNSAFLRTTKNKNFVLPNWKYSLTAYLHKKYLTEK